MRTSQSIGTLRIRFCCRWHSVRRRFSPAAFRPCETNVAAIRKFLRLDHEHVRSPARWHQSEGDQMTPQAPYRSSAFRPTRWVPTRAAIFIRQASSRGARRALDALTHEP
jgi:hypothetical protein